ncbi:MAG: MGMT family protein [Nitrososphaerales archaeon]
MNLSEKVYSLVTKIPRGKVTTYGELARAVGRPKSSRVIGQILNKNPDPIVVPCHRVVRSTGDLGGYANGSKKKSKLLEREGVQLSNGKILDFKKVNFKF